MPPGRLNPVRMPRVCVNGFRRLIAEGGTGVATGGGKMTLTELEWLLAEDARPLLAHLRTGPARRRKLRLFACAVCRGSGDGLDTERGRRAAELAERFADGTALKREMSAARSAARGLPRAVANALAWRAAEIAAAWSPSTTTVALLRDVFGNPFRPVTVDRAWLTWSDGTILQLARAAYEERCLPSGVLDPARIAILADALEDAGCTITDVVGHCRSGGAHVRGCWVVDMLLGKE